MKGMPLWVGVVGILIIVGILLIGRGGSRRNQTGRVKVPWSALKGRLSRKAALAAAQRRIPAAADGTVPPDDTIVFTGLYGAGHGVYTQLEDSWLVLGPPRSGKTLSVAHRAVQEAVGPVVATSTKEDLIRLTRDARSTVGRLWLYDPVGTLTPDAAAGLQPLRWDPVDGCQDAETALRRGAAWAAAQPMGNVRNGDWFNQRASELLARLLHAAALDGRDVMTVYRWSQNLHDPEPAAILNRLGPPGWGAFLEGLSTSRAGETVDALKMSVGGVLGALASPRIVATLTPGPGGEQFRPAEFLAGSNTLYLVADQKAGAAVAPVFTMLVDEILHTAALASQTHPQGFLWPPLRGVFDEIANLAPLPNLDAYMSDSGGRGIQLMPIVQSRPQMKKRWGPDAASAIWMAATGKLILPGCDDGDLARELEAGAGRRRVARTTVSTGRGGRSVSTGTEWEQNLPAAAVKDIPEGTGWLTYRTLPTTLISLPLMSAKPKPRSTARRS